MLQAQTDLTSRIDAVDPEVGAAIRDEFERQQYTLELIPSENIASPAVLQALGSLLNNKYAGAGQLQSPEHFQVDHDLLAPSRISDQGCVRGPSHGPAIFGQEDPPAAKRSTWCAWAGGSNRP